MKNSFSVLIVAVFTFFATSAFAGNVYFSGSGGFTGLEDSSFDATLGALSGNGKYSFEAGWNAGGALGYDFGMFRTDFEFGYRKNDFDSVSVAGTTFEISSADVSVLSYMANAYFDFENSTSVTPYLGFGLGVADIKIEDSIGDGSDTVFAYQFRAGMDFKLSPAFSLTGDYTFFGTSDPTFNTQGLITETEYHSHNINGGVRFNF